MNISFALQAREISTSRLTSNQRYVGQQITVSKNLFLKHHTHEMARTLMARIELKVGSLGTNPIGANLG